MAVEKSDEKEGNTFKWRWRCDCGGEKVSAPYNVRKSGDNASCGCESPLVRDITGERVGKLVAVERTEEKPSGQYKWLWKCDCGNERVATPRDIRKRGDSASCGCDLVTDKTGERYGKLTAIRLDFERMKESKQKGAWWIWRCDCGTEVSRKADYVKKLSDKADCGKSCRLRQ